MKAQNLLVENVFGLIRNWRSESKLELIAKLKDSLKEIPDEKKESWKELFGAWDDDETAEELISTLRNSRGTNRILEDL